MLPAKRASHDDAKILAADFTGHEAIELQARDAAGLIPRQHAHIPQPVAAKP